MSTDANIPTDVGDECSVINVFTGRKLKIASTSKASMDGAISFLVPESQSRVQTLEATSPMYEGVKSMKLRALISVILGGDACPGGVKDIGTKKLATKLAQVRDSGCVDEDKIFDKLMEYAIEQSKPKPKKTSPPQFSKEVLATFVDAIIYQPTNELEADGTTKDQRKYLMPHPPKHLPKYLEEFKGEATIIDPGPTIMQCKGCREHSSHTFLAAVTHHDCKRCQQTVCKLCSAKISDEEHCLPCYHIESA